MEDVELCARFDVRDRITPQLTDSEIVVFTAFRGIPERRLGAGSVGNHRMTTTAKLHDG